METSRDRSASFEPQIIRKRETVLAENLEPRILSMYGLGMSLRDISAHLKELYDMDISYLWRVRHKCNLLFCVVNLI